jgi:hypothetical protein
MTAEALYFKSPAVIDRRYRCGFHTDSKARRYTRNLDRTIRLVHLIQAPSVDPVTSVADPRFPIVFIHIVERSL